MMLPTFSLRGVLLGLAALGLVGCADNDPSPAAGGGGGKGGKLPLPGTCLTPSEGCPCSTDIVVKCGVKVSQTGNTATCRQGERSCVDGEWGECVGAKTTQVYSPPPSAPGVRLQALGTPESCMDLCDPYCQHVADTPDGVTAGPEFTVDPGGISLDTEGFTGSNCPDVVIDPPTTTLTITAINDDGTVVPDTLDLQSQCGAAGPVIDPDWSVDQPDRAAVADGTLRVFSGVAGDVNVTASSLVDNGTSLVHVKVDINVVTGISAAIQGQFAAPGMGTDPGKTLYPYRNTVFPLDLKAPLVQWQTGGTAASNVQVALRYPAGSADPLFWYSKIFSGEPTEGTLHQAGAPAWQIPQAVWTAFGRTAAGQNAEIIVQRRNSGGTVFQDMIIPVRFSSEALRGTAYYTQYLRRLFVPGAGVLQSGQDDLPENYNPLAPGVVCPVGNNTHSPVTGGSTTRAIDMSNPAATNLDPFNGAGGCPVCHSVSANGSVYVAGSRFLQTWEGGTNQGFVNSIGLSATGMASFTELGEAPNYSSLATGTDWNGRGFAFAALTPDGSLALQGPGWWGNSEPYGGDNLTIDRAWRAGGQIRPMFFVPTTNVGAVVQFATTAALTATRTGNVLSGSGALPAIDGYTPAVNESILVKNQATAADNGIYVVTNLGAPIGGCGGPKWTPTGTSASSGGGSHALAVDGNATTTRWESAHGVDPQWLRLDLGQSRYIGCVRIDWEGANARNYTIQVSNDDTNWTTVATRTGMPEGNHRIDYLAGLNTTARYIRVHGTVRNLTYGYSIWEIDVHSSELTSAVIAAANVAASSTENATYPATAAFDNNATTRWASVHGPNMNVTYTQWLRVDLGASRCINRVNISWEAASARDYTIQVSDDTTNWTTIATRTNQAAGARTDNLTGLSGVGRYVRVNATARTAIAGNYYGYSIFEMDVWGDVCGTPFQLTRRADAQSPPTAAGTIKAGWEVRVTRGTANYAKVFRLTSPATDPTINTSSLVFSDINASQLPVMTMPTISPDGSKIAYVSGDTDPIGGNTTAWRKGLTMLDLNQAARTVSNKKRLVNNYNAATPGTGGVPIKWPFFEHDSRSLLFVETDVDEYCAGGRTGGTDPWRACFGDGPAFANAAPTQRGLWPGRLYSIDTAAVTPSSTKTELATLNDAEDPRDADKAFQPTVLPFVSGGYRWVIFTSPRSYGNQLNQLGPTAALNDRTHFTCAATLLWVAALEDQIAGAADRSHPAFLLPGQNMAPILGRASGDPDHYVNERGYLVPSPCKANGLSCTTSDECCGTSECRVDTIPMSGAPTKVCKDATSCSTEGGACLTDADCCGGAPCMANHCVNLPSYTEATFTRTYFAECPSGFHPQWGLFSFHLTTPANSHIDFTAQTARQEGGLDMAQVVPLVDSSSDNFDDEAEWVDVGAALVGADVSSSLFYLRISMRFHPSTGGAVSPILHDWEQRYSCVPAE